MSKNPKVDEIRIDPDIKEFFGDVICKYTSDEAVEDGVLFDLDPLLISKKMVAAGEIANFPIKYVTTSLLYEGYYNDRCKNAVLVSEAGVNDRCKTCQEFIVFANNLGTKDHKPLPCQEKTLNIPNLLDLINQALHIFRKKPADDYFVSGTIELPSGKKQTIFIKQNESGRYTAMLPEDD